MGHGAISNQPKTHISEAGGVSQAGKAAVPATVQTGGPAPAPSQPKETVKAAAKGSAKPSVDLAAPEPAAEFALDPSQKNAKGQSRLVYANGTPPQGAAVYIDEKSGQPTDKAGKPLPYVRLADKNYADGLKVVMKGVAIEGGAYQVLFNKTWFDKSVPQLEKKLATLQTRQVKINRAIRNGKTYVSAGSHLPAKVEAKSNVRKQVGTQNAIRIRTTTAQQQAEFNAAKKLNALHAESAEFQAGKSMLGRMKNAPVVGTVANKIEAGRQIQIRQIRTQIKTGTVEPGFGTRMANATRGRVLPAAMAAYFTFSTAMDIKESAERWNDPTNVHKWDDGARIAGDAMQTGGALAALKRGNVTGAFYTAIAGTVLSTIGSFARD